MVKNGTLIKKLCWKITVFPIQKCLQLYFSFEILLFQIVLTSYVTHFHYLDKNW